MNYAERLTVPLRWWVQGTMLVASLWLAVLVATPEPFAWSVAAIALAAMVALFVSYGRARVGVVDGELVTAGGRVLSVTNMAMFGAMPVGSLLAAVLGEKLGAWSGGWFGPEASGAAAVQLGVGSMALLLTVLGVLLLVFRTPEIDGPGPGADVPQRARGLWRGMTAAAHRPHVA